jgi:hypothetical protein
MSPSPVPASRPAHFELAAPTGLPAVVRSALWLIGVRPERDGVWLDEDRFVARFGPWRLSAPRSDVVDAEVTGPYSAWKAIGPRLSLADRGLTFGTAADRGVCVRFRRPVAGIEPSGLLRHPTLTVTVAEPDLLLAALGHPAG